MFRHATYEERMTKGIRCMTEEDPREFEEVKAALRARAARLGVAVSDVQLANASVSGNYLAKGLKLSYKDCAYDIFYDVAREQTDLFHDGKCLLTFSSNPDWGARLILQTVKERAAPHSPPNRSKT